MEESSDRELEAILKLIKLTQDGTLKWEAAMPWGDLVENEATQYSSVFSCDYGDKLLRMFTEKKRIDKPSGLFQHLMDSQYLNGDRKYPYWAEKVVLEITNQNGQSLWRFPYKSAIGDLFSAAKYQVAGVKDLLDSLLSNPTEAS